MSADAAINQAIQDDINPLPHSTPDSVMDRITATVAECLEETYPDFVDYDNRTFTVEHGSTIVMITVRPFTDKEACIECFSQVVSGCEINTEILAFLLRKNTELHFGAFGLLFDNTITFSHSITGSDMNRDEFKNSLKVVAFIADHYDDKIVELAGGKRACDLDENDLMDQ